MKFNSISRKLKLTTRSTTQDKTISPTKFKLISAYSRSSPIVKLAHKYMLSSALGAPSLQAKAWVDNGCPSSQDILLLEFSNCG